MKRHGKLLGLAALVALALLSAPPRATADPELDRAETQRQLDNLRKQIVVLRGLAEAERATTELEMRQVRERLDRIERALARLSSTSTRSASSFTPSDPLTRSTLRLSNRLPVTAYVSVNGVTYSVPPFGLRTLRNVPLGAVTYEVSATGYYARAAATTTLVADETLTVNINAPAVPVVGVPVVVLP
jgi:hypothetical protein